MPPANLPPAEPPVEVRGVTTRSRGKLYVLAAATVLGIYLCYRIVAPFLPALVWAITAAVVTHRFSQWVGRRVSSASVKAGVCTATAVLAILLPVVFVGYVGVRQVGQAVAELQSEETVAKFQEWLEQRPRVKQAWEYLSTQANGDGKQQSTLFESLQPGAMAALSTPFYMAMQLMLTPFILFFLYRDEAEAIDSLRGALPLSEGESDRLLSRVEDTIHATIYGVLVVAMIQGFMGGFIFAVLGIPGAVLWGVVMGFLAIIPYLGTFVVWGPTAGFLATQGEWISAAVLVTWGLLAIGLIDNLLYPMLVGHRLRQHTVVAFFAILGGVSVFGATGLVLGPVIVSATFFLLDVWRRRTEHGHSAERP